MKAQVSVETIIAVAVLFVLLGVVLVHNTNVSGSAELLEEKFGNQKECLKFAYLISEVYSQGNGTSIGIELEKSAEVFSEQKAVKVGQDFCRFLAITEAMDGESFSGKITIANVNGTIEIEETG